MHQQPPQTPLFASTSAAKSSQVPGVSRRVVYWVTADVTVLLSCLMLRPEGRFAWRRLVQSSNSDTASQSVVLISAVYFRYAINAGVMKLLLTDSGVRNASILAALVDLLGKPIAEASALCIPTAGYGARTGIRAAHGVSSADDPPAP